MRRRDDVYNLADNDKVDLIRQNEWRLGLESGRREMFAEVMRVVDEFEDSDASKYLEGAWLSLWQRTVDAIIDNIRALDPDGDA